MILGALAVCSLYLAAADPVGAGGPEQAAAPPANRATAQWVVLRIDGPNDGELLEGRSCIALRVSTNYVEDAVLAVYVGGRFARVVELFPEEGDETQTAEFEVDLAAHGLTAEELADEEGELHLTFYLFRAADGYLVTSTRWSVRVVEPWLDFLVPLGAPDDDRPAAAREPLAGTDFLEKMTVERPGENIHDPIIPQGTIALEPHAPPAEQYFVVLTSDRRDVLTLRPEDPRVARGAFPLAAGFVGRALGDEAVLPPVPLPPPSGRGTYVVLWTYSQRSGWIRSSIYRHAQ